MKKRISHTTLMLFSTFFPLLAFAEPVSMLQETALLSSLKVPAPVHRSIVHYGIASWYSESDPHINPTTANGEIFDDSQLTCASWTYPFGTRLRVVNRTNGKSIVCRVNDRGPSKRLKRLIDLTKTAFSRIADLKEGLIEVSVTRVRS